MREIKNLDTLMDGALTERFNQEFKKVLQNVFDPNTDPKKKRKLTMIVSVTPNERRDAADLQVDVTTTLAAHVPTTQTVFISMQDDGTVHALEQTGQLPGQIDMEGNVNIPNEVNFGGETAPDMPDVINFNERKAH